MTGKHEGKFGILNLCIMVLLMVGLSGIVHSAELTMYWQVGCGHCAATERTFQSIHDDYNFTVNLKEIRYNQTNLQEIIAKWKSYNVPRELWGTPTTIINGKLMVIGELSGRTWISLMKECDEGNCPATYLTSSNVDEFLNHYNGQNNSQNSNDNNGNDNDGETGGQTGGDNGNASSDYGDEGITWTGLIMGALADSVNPCTIAVMAMLLTTILLQHNRRKVLLAGTAFTLTIFVCYLLMGLGILKAVQATGLQLIFLGVMTVVAGIMTVLEFNGYFNYKPGMVSIEMPMFLRPHVKRLISMATSIPFVILVAVFCSLFLLPCSSGPYLVVISMLAQSPTSGLLHLIVYNIIFVMPMVAVTLIVGVGLSTPEKVKEARDRYVRYMHLIAGILMLVVTCLVAYQFLDMIGWI